MSKQMTAENERKAALDILLEIKLKGTPVAVCLDRYFHARDIKEKRSRAFITQLVYGTLENIIRLDYIIEAFSKIKVKKMKPIIAAVLEMSVYQIFYMDSVPASAACDEAVKLAKKSGLSGLSGFVNGILRNIVRNCDSVVFPDRKEDFIKYISLEYCLPEWCIRQWIKDYGKEKTELISKGIRKRSPMFIRVNTLRISGEELAAKLESEGVKVLREPEWPPYVYAISGIDSVSSLESFREGLFYIQDLSCILSGEMYGLKKEDSILDVCAAPGGKSINAALILDSLGGGKVTACDVSDEKVALIRENIQRMRIANIDFCKSDATVFKDEFREAFDVAVADVPCSGLGIIGRKPDIILRLKEADITSLVALQRDIIDNSVKYVKKGGRFVLSTCTLNKQENEGNLNYIIENHGLNLICSHTNFPGEKAGGDGFFTAVFGKQE